MRLISLIFLGFSLQAQNYHRIGHFREGGHAITHEPILAYDSNHNGYPELYYSAYQYPYIYFTRIREYRPYNRYIAVGTLKSQDFQSIGDFDNDGRVDLLSIWGNLYVFEQKFPDPYPTHQVWKSDSSYGARGAIHVADLDSDGKMDFLFNNAGGEIWLYENIGDNQYALVWDTVTVPDEAGYNFTSGDFDQDGKVEFATGTWGSNSTAAVYECIGDNQYQCIFHDSVALSNCQDVWFGNDLDQDGKTEFIIGSHPASGGSWAYQFRVYEAIADNRYAVSWTSDIVYRPFSFNAGIGSYCGDVDGDGQDEIIWAVQDNWYIYKAFGNNNYQRVFTAYPDYNWHAETRVYVYDLNGNGYPEIIETGGTNGNGPNDSTETVIWEIEAVRLLYPNGGEVFNPGDTVEITWKTFDPPGCDSLSLFFSADSGYNYDTIVTGIPASDTTYQWIVPDTTSSQCMLMIWAYGPGVGWDFTDSTFTVGVGVAEDRPRHPKQEFRIYPNPSSGPVHLDLPVDVEQLTLFDAAGRLVHRLSPSPNLRLALPPGIYFLQIKTQTQTRTEKLIVLR